MSRGGELARGGPRNGLELVLARCGGSAGEGEGEISDSRRRRDITGDMCNN